MIKLSCNSCGAKLELTDDIERFVCSHCGNEWIVYRGGGIVSLKSMEEGIKKIEEDINIITQDIHLGRPEQAIRNEEKIRLQVLGEQQIQGCLIFVILSVICGIALSVYQFLNNNTGLLLQLIFTGLLLGVILMIYNILKGNISFKSGIIPLIFLVLIVIFFVWLDFDTKRTFGEFVILKIPDWFKLYILPCLIIIPLGYIALSVLNKNKS